MGKYSIYSVPLSEQEEEKRKFEYNLTDKFFELIDGTVDIRKGQLDATLNVEHRGGEFRLSFEINGTVKVPCDRCLDEVSMDVSTKNRLIVKLGTEYSEESDEIVVIPAEDKAINVAWFIFEFIALSLPTKKIHLAGMCNKAMTAKYDKHRTEEADDGDDADEEDTEDDSSYDTAKDMGSED